MQVVRASVLVSTDQGEIASPVLQTPQISSHIWPDWVTKVTVGRVLIASIY